MFKSRPRRALTWERRTTMDGRRLDREAFAQRNVADAESSSAADDFPTGINSQKSANKHGSHRERLIDGIARLR
ncbi:hypothetical protein [Paraburkholderia guartelaensis]|uniref:hypothetical protein n=1 Tax=Paraburkholderia guartelaensis TaxID=2546446 RepID=UPI002AB7BF11|nr:hypothetical protein [Paraburkholderia guartelaensis]